MKEHNTWNKSIWQNYGVLTFSRITVYEREKDGYLKIEIMQMIEQLELQFNRTFKEHRQVI